MIDGIITIVSQYGWVGIFGLIAVISIAIGAKYLAKKMSKDVNNGIDKIAQTVTSTITTQNKELISSVKSTNEKLINYIIEARNKEDKYDVKLKSRLSITETVKQKLKEILLYHHADRILLLEFHNSNHNIEGVPFIKYSCTFEWLKQGNLSIINKYQNLPFSNISSVIKSLVESNHHQIIYSSIAELENVNPTLYYLLKKDNINSVIYNAMYDNDNHIMGLTALQFKTEIVPDSIETEILEKQVAALTPLLNIRHENSV